MTTIPIPDAIQELMRELMPQRRQARYRYWTGPRGEMYCYAIEPINGKFACWTYVPKGKGSRSGKAMRFHMTDRVDFKLRKTAKARAYSRYSKAMGE